MNPVLLKPGSDRRSQVVVLGHPEAEADAVGYRAFAPRLRQLALESLDRLRAQYDVVICEGAGSPAEINLRDTDVANMGLARAAGLPVIVVGDIDRGGVFAAMYGTLALLAAEDQALISGFVINKFRGAPELLDSGLRLLQERTGGRCSASCRGAGPGAATPRIALAGRCGTCRRARSAYMRFSPGRGGQAAADQQLHRRGRPAAEPGVLVRFAASPAELADADLVVLPVPGPPCPTWPGCASARWPARSPRGPRAGQPVLGHPRRLPDAGPGRSPTTWNPAGAPVDGLACCRPGAVRRRGRSRAARTAGPWGVPVAGDEIHHGQAEITDPAGRTFPGRLPPRCGVGDSAGTASLENDESARAFLTEVAALAGRDFTPAPGHRFRRRAGGPAGCAGRPGGRRHLEAGAPGALISAGPPPGLPRCGIASARSIGFAHARHDPVHRGGNLDGDGRAGHVVSSDHRLDLDLAPPVEMGGSGDGTNPEQLFAAGYSACFHSALRLIARRAKVDPGESTVTAEVGSAPTGTRTGSSSP